MGLKDVLLPAGMTFYVEGSYNESTRTGQNGKSVGRANGSPTSGLPRLVIDLNGQLSSSVQYTIAGSGFCQLARDYER